MKMTKRDNLIMSVTAMNSASQIFAAMINAGFYKDQKTDFNDLQQALKDMANELYLELKSMKSAQTNDSDSSD